MKLFRKPQSVVSSVTFIPMASVFALQHNNLKNYTGLINQKENQNAPPLICQVQWISTGYWSDTSAHTAKYDVHRGKETSQDNNPASLWQYLFPSWKKTK